MANLGIRIFCRELCGPPSFYEHCSMKGLLLCIGLFSLLPAAQAQKAGDRNLALLKSRMTGSFSTAAQAKADTAFLDIVLEVRQVWPKRKDGYWLYVEQAVAASPDRPYRQRMYHLYVFDDSTWVSQVFEFKEPALVAGWWKEPRRFDSVKFHVLSSRVGCEVYLRKQKDGRFVGGTEGQDCSSSLRGANYATSEVVITATEMRSWDRGWNADHQQVWGSKTGPYVFVRRNRK